MSRMCSYISCYLLFEVARLYWRLPHYMSLFAEKMRSRWNLLKMNLRVRSSLYCCSVFNNINIFVRTYGLKRVLLK